MAEKLDLDEVEDTEDIYNEDQMEEMLEEDEISDKEAGFMEGHENPEKTEDEIVLSLKKKRKLFERAVLVGPKKSGGKKGKEEPERLLLKSTLSKNPKPKTTVPKNKSKPMVKSKPAKTKKPVKKAVAKPKKR
ncbi:MAG: hypothetical protein Q7R47_03085 [Candidatus Diapherotrites archaeon]|nr:hypothetical protein [Candidatus Diapherotrites archaeon]